MSEDDWQPFDTAPKVRVNCIMPGPFATEISAAWDWEAFERAVAIITEASHDLLHALPPRIGPSRLLRLRAHLRRAGDPAADLPVAVADPGVRSEGPA